MYPTTDGITPDLPEPDWDAVAAQLAEKTRLAAYDETEIKQLREIYPPETAAALLRPAYTLRERIALLPRGVLVLMAALLSTVIALGVWVATTPLTTPAAEGQGTAVPADSGGVSAGFAAPGEFTEQQGAAAANGGAAGVAAAGSASTPEIVVHVVGEVHQPGVYTLPAGSRITAALEQAGGATPAAAVEALNLARVLVDGEKITVPSAAQVAEGWVAADAAGEGAGGGSTTGNSPGKINLNTATVQQLEQLPKIGAVTAANIVAWRDAHGGFQSVEQLLEVGGIGEKTLTLLREHVTL
ncbi:ComEA family DNA-binding protein [Leucobacter sp. OH2974_COT-288]|nr:ComEA family DNA-binding protein [Leucobacter sp. OH2974_COT-288]